MFRWVALTGLATWGMTGGASASPPVAERAVAPSDTTTTGVDAGGREDAPVQERWQAPFAVTSRGRTSERGERTVVVLRDSVAPQPAPVAEAPAAPAGPPAAAARPAGGGSAPPATGRPATGRPAAAERGAAPQVGRPASVVRTHRVEWGETWYGIARQHGVAPRDLAAANPNVDPEKLTSGHVLRIPGSSQPRAGRRVHTVEPGESLWGIARRYGVGTDAVRKANGLKDDRVRIGEKLVIPGGGG